MKRRIGYSNSKRMELFLLASMLDALMRTGGDAVNAPPERCSKASKDIFDTLRNVAVHDASASRQILMSGFGRGNGEGAASFSLSVSLPMGRSNKKQFISKKLK